MNVYLTFARHLFFKIIIPSFLIFNLSFVIISSALAQISETDLIINGENVSYDSDNNLVEASGSVEVSYKDIDLTGHHIFYHTKTESISAEGGFSLYYEGITIEGQTLDYLIKEKTGTAKDVKIYYGGIHLQGKDIAFSKDEFNLNGAYFTTCDRGDYYVTAKDIVFYPEHGWMVAYWGYFWFYRLPLIPMPTYIYDLYAADKEKRNLPPFPEISSNDEDGTYVNEKLAWHLKRELSGTYSLSHASKKGFGFGAEAFYILNDNNRGRLRSYWNQTDLWSGGGTHSILFGRQIQDESIALSFIPRAKYYQYSLDTTVSYRERINYQKVSFLPLVELKERSGRFLNSQLNYDASISAGLISERGNIRLTRWSGKFTLFKDFYDGFGKLTPNLGVDASKYSNEQSWLKYTGGFDLTKPLSDTLLYEGGYLHYFKVDGQSPFNYEMYKFRAVDKVYSAFTYRFGIPAVKVYASYYADNWSPEDIDYSLFFNMHCYNVSVTYRSLRNEFSLGFDLGRI